MSKLTVCYVTNSIEGGPAFAITSDTDEQVYIPTALAEKHDLEEMDTVKCLLIRNTLEPGKTPWFAQAVRLVPEGCEP